MKADCSDSFSLTLEAESESESENENENVSDMEWVGDGETAGWLRQ